VWLCVYAYLVFNGLLCCRQLVVYVDVDEGFTWPGIALTPDDLAALAVFLEQFREDMSQVEID
jgi:hypothetical protein